MKTWQLPAKTFLLGEYIAMMGGPALLATTSPYFELSLVEDGAGLLEGIHPESPAGLWWALNGDARHGLRWVDPYHGLGGLGASSAQFLGAYLAGCYVANKPVSKACMLEAYLQSAWLGHGARPSGYDVMAQFAKGIVFIDKNNAICESMTWPFNDISFLFAHTGQKLATHRHLQTLSLTDAIKPLGLLVEKGVQAFKQADSQGFIQAIDSYHHALAALNLVAPHTVALIEACRAFTDIKAIKGCGALGADIVLILISPEKKRLVSYQLETLGLVVLDARPT